MVHEWRPDNDRSRFRDLGPRPGRRRDSSWEDNARHNNEYRAPERPRNRPRDNGSAQRAGTSSPIHPTPIRNAPSADLFPNKQTASVNMKQLPAALPSSALPPRAMKQLLDLICERTFWWTHRDDAVKTWKKTQLVLDRCRTHSSDFGNAIDHCAHQKKAADDAKSRTESRLSETDEKITALLGPAYQNLANQATPADVVGPTEEIAGLETRQIAARHSMQQSLEEMFTKETETMKRTMDQLYGAQVSELKDSLAKESRRNNALEEKMASLEQMLEEMRNTKTATIQNDDDAMTDNVPSVNGIAELAATQGEQISQLVTRLDCLEENLSEIQKLAKQVDDHSSAIKDHADEQRERNQVLTSLQSAISKLPTDSLETIPAELSSIKAQIESAGTSYGASYEASYRASHEAGPSLTSISDDRLWQMVQPKFEKFKESIEERVDSISIKLAPYLGQERVLRVALEKRVDQATGEISELRNDVDAIKTGHAVIDQLSDQSRKHATDLIHHGQGIASVDTRLDGAMRDSRKELDGIHVLLQSMSTWQNNFDTRGLYKDIVNHINVTMPEGTSKQVRSLANRLEAVESRCLTFEVGATKKRKLQNGNAAAANGRH